MAEKGGCPESTGRRRKEEIKEAPASIRWAFVCRTGWTGSSSGSAVFVGGEGATCDLSAKKEAMFGCSDVSFVECRASLSIGIDGYVQRAPIPDTTNGTATPWTPWHILAPPLAVSQQSVVAVPDRSCLGSRKPILHGREEKGEVLGHTNPRLGLPVGLPIRPGVPLGGQWGGIYSSPIGRVWAMSSHWLRVFECLPKCQQLWGAWSTCSLMVQNTWAFQLCNIAT